MKRALVTGASGFIGRRLCDRLVSEGVGVRAVMRHGPRGPWDESYALDLGRDAIPPSLLRGVDTLFHLAGKAHAVTARGDAAVHQRVTVAGTRDLLAAAVDARVSSVVYFSSVKVMGERNTVCQDETAACHPETPYGAARLEAETLIREFGERTGAHAVVLRLPMVYGPGAGGNLDRMLSSVAAGRFPPLPECGNRRSMVHVDDVVEAALCAVRSPVATGETYILTDGRAYSTREIYDLMRAALGMPERRWSLPVPVFRLLARMGDIIGAMGRKRFVFDSDAWQKLSESAWYSSAKAERDLGFRPSHTLGDTLPLMAAPLARGH